MANPGRIQALTNNACDPSDMDASLEYLVPFLAQGFLADPIPKAPIMLSEYKHVNELKP